MTYIAPQAKTLAHVDRLVDWRRGLKPAPVTVEWDLSNRCVLGCQDCHFAHTHVKGPWAIKSRLLPMAYSGTGDLADYGVVTLAMREMKIAGVKGIVWSGGGEPTTHGRWQEIIAFAKSWGFEQGMYTCGGLMTERSGEFAGNTLTWVVVSLDCPDAETYAEEKGVPPDRFYAACNGVRWLSGHAATVGVSFLLHYHNWRRAPEMLNLARALGANYATFRPAIQTLADAPSKCSEDTGWISDALPTLEKLSRNDDVEISLHRFVQYQKWDGHGYDVCKGVQLNTTVTPDGRVWMCPQRRGVGKALGDISKESFHRIWAGHPGHYVVDEGCRVMCRLHPVNQQVAALDAVPVHGAFI